MNQTQSVKASTAISISKLLNAHHHSEQHSQKLTDKQSRIAELH